MAINVMSDARKFTRNKSTTSTTRSDRRASAASRLSSARWMKSACRNTCLSITMPSGKRSLDVIERRIQWRVNSRVLAPGCF